MFPVYGGKCLSRKAVHSWVEKFSQGRSEVADDARPGVEVAETTVKRLLCCGFRRTGKAIGHVYQCWWRICREINVFPTFEYHMFYVLYPFVAYLLIPLRTSGVHMPVGNSNILTQEFSSVKLSTLGTRMTWPGS
jgi:hypothetical protein